MLKTRLPFGYSTLVFRLSLIAQGVDVKSGASETRLLSQIGALKKNRVLACCHTADEVSTGTVTPVEV